MHNKTSLISDALFAALFCLSWTHSSLAGEFDRECRWSRTEIETNWRVEDLVATRDGAILGGSFPELDFAPFYPVGEKPRIPNNSPIPFVGRWDSEGIHLPSDNLFAFGFGFSRLTQLFKEGNRIIAVGLFRISNRDPEVSIAKWENGKWDDFGSDLFGAELVAINGAEMYAARRLGAGLDGRKPSEQFGKDLGQIAQGRQGQWTAVPSKFPVRGHISALAIGNRGLYVGGAFSDVNGIQGTTNIAFWDGNNWSPLGAGLDGEVSAMAFTPRGLIAAGSFKTAGANPAGNYIARWNEKEWQALGEGIGRAARGGSVNSLAVLRDSLYVSGQLLTDWGYPGSDAVMRFDGSEWRALSPEGLARDKELHIKKIAAGDGRLVASAVEKDPTHKGKDRDVLLSYPLTCRTPLAGKTENSAGQSTLAAPDLIGRIAQARRLRDGGRIQEARRLAWSAIFEFGTEGYPGAGNLVEMFDLSKPNEFSELTTLNNPCTMALVMSSAGNGSLAEFPIAREIGETLLNRGYVSSSNRAFGVQDSLRALALHENFGNESKNAFASVVVPWVKDSDSRIQETALYALDRLTGVGFDRVTDMDFTPQFYYSAKARLWWSLNKSKPQFNLRSPLRFESIELRELDSDANEESVRERVALLKSEDFRTWAEAMRTLILYGIEKNTNTLLRVCGENKATDVSFWTETLTRIIARTQTALGPRIYRSLEECLRWDRPRQ